MMRLDVFLVNHAYCETRTKAKDLIMLGMVSVNNEIIVKPSQLVSEEDLVMVQNCDCFVSRAAYKLKQALDTFQIDLSEKIVLDIGASTGGFTECALQYGASFVYAIDVGTSQLHPKLKQDERVCSLEQTDARNLVISMFEKAIDFICMDVSFISSRNILPIIADLLYDKKEAIILVKPQFELEKKVRNKRGIVKNEKDREMALKSVIKEAQILGLTVIDSIPCDTIGRDGNIEYLLYLKK